MRLMTKLIFLLSVALYFTGCNKSEGGGEGPAKACTKPITSVWKASDPELNATFDMSEFTIGEESTYTIWVEGARCDMDLLITGSECSGAITASNAIYLAGGSGDPGCSYFNGTSLYDIKGKVATVCDALDLSDCLTYE